ncbi:MAG: DNA recombination protein RmuC [Rhizobiales bacterium]|nr:DNA recombination protein RmuC [Hyphomicrobiales bacterium]
MDSETIERLGREFGAHFGEIRQAFGTFLASGMVWPVAAILLLLAALLLAGLALSARARRHAGREAEERALSAQLLRTNQALAEQIVELRGRIGAMAELGARHQADLATTLDARLDHVTSEMVRSLKETRTEMDRQLGEATSRLATGLTASSEGTGSHLEQLAERLAVIDRAQQSLAELSGRVVSLQNVLANKQARGAFGQVRMETIIQDALPASAYSFQATLSNGKRPDCLIRLPNAAAGIVVDAKFPLEGFEALRQATTPEEDRRAAAAVRQAVGRHIEEIAGKYLIAGETQETALMFVPSEAAYADLHEQFPDLIQKAHRAHVFIVSPNMLMLAVQTMQAILKDVKVREAAGAIQREVTLMLEDVARLAERISDLERQFGQAQRSLEKVSTSAGRIVSRGARIEALELDEGGPGEVVADVATGGDPRLLAKAV